LRKDSWVPIAMLQSLILWLNRRIKIRYQGINRIRFSFVINFPSQYKKIRIHNGAYQITAFDQNWPQPMLD
jgi:hypothetical protein